MEGAQVVPGGYRGFCKADGEPVEAMNCPFCGHPDSRVIEMLGGFPSEVKIPVFDRHEGRNVLLEFSVPGECAYGIVAILLGHDHGPGRAKINTQSHDIFFSLLFRHSSNSRSRLHDNNVNLFTGNQVTHSIDLNEKGSLLLQVSCVVKQGGGDAELEGGLENLVPFFVEKNIDESATLRLDLYLLKHREDEGF
jgi:hypothetical protein